MAGQKRGARCSICASGLAAKVNQALTSGVSTRDIAAHTGCTKSAVARHKINPNCYPAAIKRSIERREAYSEASAGKALPQANPTGKKITASRAFIREAESTAEAFKRGELGQEPASHKPLVGELVDEAENEASDGAAGQIGGTQPGQEQIPAEKSGEKPELSCRALAHSGPGFSPRSPLRDLEDYAGRIERNANHAQDVVEGEAAGYAEEPTPGRGRSVGNAVKVANEALLMAAKMRGVYKEGPSTDARSINIYAALSDEELAAKRAELEALRDAMLATSAGELNA